MGLLVGLGAVGAGVGAGVDAGVGAGVTGLAVGSRVGSFVGAAVGRRVVGLAGGTAAAAGSFAAVLDQASAPSWPQPAPRAHPAASSARVHSRPPGAAPAQMSRALS